MEKRIQAKKKKEIYSGCINDFYTFASAAHIRYRVQNVIFVWVRTLVK